MKRLGPERCAMCYFRGHVFNGPCSDDWTTFYPTGKTVNHMQQRRKERVNEIRKSIMWLHYRKQRDKAYVLEHICANFRMSRHSARDYLRAIQREHHR